MQEEQDRRKEHRTQLTHNSSSIGNQSLTYEQRERESRIATNHLPINYYNFSVVIERERERAEKLDAELLQFYSQWASSTVQPEKK